MLPALKPIMMSARVSLIFIEYGQIDKDDNGRQNARGAVKSCRVPLIVESNNCSGSTASSIMLRALRLR